LARRRWTSPALNDLRHAIEWIDEHVGAAAAAATTVEIREAARRAAARPTLYAWVGSLHPPLAVLPSTVRRVLTRTRRYVVFYRYDRAAHEIVILAVRGTAQLPPRPDELGT